MTPDVIHVSVVSHSCILPANQQVWARVAVEPDLRNINRKSRRAGNRPS